MMAESSHKTFNTKSLSLLSLHPPNLFHKLFILRAHLFVDLRSYFSNSLFHYLVDQESSLSVFSPDWHLLEFFFTYIIHKVVLQYNIHLLRSIPEDPFHNIRIHQVLLIGIQLLHIIKSDDIRQLRGEWLVGNNIILLNHNKGLLIQKVVPEEGVHEVVG